MILISKVFPFTVFLFLFTSFHHCVPSGCQIDPDEVEDDDEVILIWEFQIQERTLSVTSASSLVRPNIPSLPDKMPAMPLLNLSEVECNCTCVRRGHVLLQNEAQSATRGLQNLSLAENSEEEESQEEDSSLEEVVEEWDEDESDFDVHAPTSAAVEFVPDNNASSKDTMFTETFTLKGSSFHDHFQCALRLCRESLKKKESIPVKLIFEPVNRRDENAITVQAQFDTWQPIGYIPGIKVPKVTEGIRNKEITKIVITNVKYQYIFPISSFKFIATVSISKIGKWRKNKDNYKYNEDI